MDEADKDGGGSTRMSDNPAQAADHLARRLAERGYEQHAQTIAGALALGVQRAALHALREAVQTVLSAVEAFDPETEAMIEELRLSVDRRLEGSHAAEERAAGTETGKDEHGAS